jgi:SAM-dependent methyltransferase
MKTEDAQGLQKFLEVYERIRAAEQWGGDDLDLPFHPLRHREIWAIRRRTFSRFREFVRKTWPGSRRGRIAIDAGAGNCWLTQYLQTWGFEAIACDISVSHNDGLLARLIDSQSPDFFSRIQANMETLPFAGATVDLIVANASCHYVHDLTALLSEFRRVLAPHGRIVILDSPFYSNPADGDRMLSERVVEYRKQFEAPEGLVRQVSYLTYERLKHAAYNADLACTIDRIWPGPRRTYEKIRGRILGRRIAEFPMAILSPIPLHFAHRP